MSQHRNPGDARHMNLYDWDQLPEAAVVLVDACAVEELLPAELAAERFHLQRRQIGGLMVLAKVEGVLGQLCRQEVALVMRCYGSLHARAVPLIACGSLVPVDAISNSRDGVACLRVGEEPVAGRMEE